MATIRFRRGNTDPVAGIAPTGLTAGEPVFNTADNKFWIGGTSGGFTAIWVGAAIENSPNWNSPSPIKLATQEAISSLVNSRVSGATGQVVTRIGVSGDWRVRGVTLFTSGPTGGITLGSEVWQGSATAALNSFPSFGITAGTVLTGKTPMEILELMLVQYLTPALSNFNMQFDPEGSGNTSNFAYAFGMTADNDTSSPTYSISNTVNVNTTVGAVITASSTGGHIQGDFTGNLVVFPNAVTGSGQVAFGPATKYKGISFGSGSSCFVTFQIAARNTQGTTFTTTRTYNWYPRIFFGRSTNAGLTYPLDAWKNPNQITGVFITTTSGNTTGAMMTTGLPYSFTVPAGASDEYIYFWLDASFSPTTIKSDGFVFSTTNSSGDTITGLTLDDGYTTRTYKRWRSQNTLASQYTINLT